MGNRATVIFTDKSGKSISPAVYVHWNGGPESIYAFLDEMNRRNIRADQDYECARFIHIVGDYFDEDTISGLSLGVVNGPRRINIAELAKVKTDTSDNGIYVVDRTNLGKPIVRRFLTDYYAKNAKGENTYPLIEKDKEWVDAEREAAYKHEYNAKKVDRDGKVSETIAETFKKITGKKEIAINQ